MRLYLLRLSLCTISMEGKADLISMPGGTGILAYWMSRRNHTSLNGRQLSFRIYILQYQRINNVRSDEELFTNF
jgi:hypothetical protein